MVFLTLNLIVFKNLSQFVFSSFLSNCYRDFLLSSRISFLVKYELFCLVSSLSDAILSLLVSFLKWKLYLIVVFTLSFSRMKRPG